MQRPYSFIRHMVSEIFHFPVRDSTYSVVVRLLPAPRSLFLPLAEKLQNLHKSVSLSTFPLVYIAIGGYIRAKLYNIPHGRTNTVPSDG